MPLPTIPSGNVFSSLPTGFNVDNSCRFNDGDSAVLSQSQSTSPTHDDKATVSLWFKPGNIDVDGSGFGFSGGDDASNRFSVTLLGSAANNSLYLYGKVGGSLNLNLASARRFRDVSAWYHLVVAVDTTQGVEASRVRCYINNEEVTLTGTFPSQNDNCMLVKGGTFDLGCIRGGSWQQYNFTDGYMAEAVLIDGQQLTPSSFGEADEDSPAIWKPIDVSGLTFGTNGFYMDFEDSSALGNDVSGNNNDFTATNLAAADQSLDSPTNNFCTLNALHKTSEKTFSQGNTTYAKSGSWHRACLGTIAPSNGKWYFEFKNNNNAKFEVAACNETLASNGLYFSDTTANSTYALRYSNDAMTFHTSNGSAEMIQNNSSIRTDVGQIASGDIGMMAFDCTTGKLWTGREGTWDNSGDPAAGSNPSVTWSTNFTANQTTYFGFGQESGQIVDVNFGGVAGFGGTAVSSANADADGYGNFEFAVPSGFYALCTKNLAEYG